MKLYLITHAATEMNKAADATTWSLSVAGAEQSRKLATLPMWHTIDRIILSSEPKTRLTVEPLLATHPLPVVVDPRLDELHRPGWVDDYGERVRQAFAEPTVAAGEWEVAAIALARVRAAIADLAHQYAGQTLALVGHGLTLSLYRAHLLGHRHADYEAWRQLSFAAVALVDPVAHKLIADFRAVAGTMPRGA